MLIKDKCSLLFVVLFFNYHRFFMCIYISLTSTVNILYCGKEYINDMPASTFSQLSVPFNVVSVENFVII
ncbi:putative phage-related protein [Pectobacterium atrosepticum SCRI1043]|uniref:Phage-related protein n=1 Tax=Pectobacterium atrosepticum (strain SCRI 1043 / ATCC BAA-672) TaxID=218491 RepID=Q6D057_PECAS|nr:putative phage-related protein [Pectobacterium atrosepticum SCRI1043]